MRAHWLLDEAALGDGEGYDTFRTPEPFPDWLDGRFTPWEMAAEAVRRNWWGGLDVEHLIERWGIDPADCYVIAADPTPFDSGAETAAEIADDLSRPPASDQLPNQLAETLPNPGNPDPINGFRTNRNGFGRRTIDLDFPITSGAYPFQRFSDFDELKNDIALTNEANVARLGGLPAAIEPVAITEESQAPATLLIASHCVDDLAHGLLPGPHENWFTWSV